jgi:arsenate reductase
MKFSFGSKSKMRQEKTILFVCVENAGRSKMAEIKQQKPKDITEDMVRNSTKIINMGCMMI